MKLINDESRMIVTSTDRCRFLAYVMNTRNPDECWLWLSNIDKDGYGTFWLNGKTVKAHRIAYILKYCVDPGELFVCHHCDNPPCCNPRHLFLGTPRDNQQDSVRKGRLNSQQGECGHNAKLTNEDVKEIRQLLASGIVQRVIAKQFNITQSTISAINTKKNWSKIQ